MLDLSIAILVAFQCLHLSLSRPEDGEIRLIGGATDYEGNIQIYHDKKWGSVCDDGWDLRDATVVCRQLGFSRSDFATTASRFGLSMRQIWLSNVQCWGYERNMTTCRSDGWGSGAECDTNEAAGVICKSPPVASTSPARRTRHYSNRTIAPPPLHYRRNLTGVHFRPTTTPRSTTARWTSTVTTTMATTARPPPMMMMPADEPSADEPSADEPPADEPQADANNLVEVQEEKPRHMMQVRLAGGRNNREGRVEVRLTPNSDWGVICGNGWTLREADVVCRQLSLGQGARAIQNVIFTGPTRSIQLSGVQCTGQESHLHSCIHNEVADCHGQRETIAGVMCNTELPDLVVDMEFLVSSVYLQDQPMFYLTCAMEENCLSSSAYQLDRNAFKFPWMTRRLLRFTLATKNIGRADFVSFIPKHLWQWHACHKHYHSMEVFAHFDILDIQGVKVAEGHKASFCLEDNACDHEWQKKYNCANFGDQGISVGCFDIYKHDVDCQWIDLTDVKPGVYTFKVTVNPDTKVAEMRYDNNVAVCKLYYYDSTAYLDECKLVGSSSIAVGLGG